MKLKEITIKLFYLFMLIVPVLNNLKAKIWVIPISVDVVIGSAIIVLGAIYCINEYKKDNNFIKILKEKEIKIILIMSLVFGFFSIVSIVNAGNKPAVISEFMRLVEYVALFVIILLVTEARDLKRGLYIFLFSMSIAAIVGVCQYYFDIPNVYEVGEFKEEGRIYATFVNPNYWGAAVNLVIFLPIVNIIERKEFKRVTNYLLLALFAFNLIFAYTRGAWVGFFFGMAIVFFLSYKKGLLSVPIIIALLIVQPSTRGRFLSMFNSSNDWTSIQRFRLWKIGIKIFKENPLLGIGNGNWKYVYRTYSENDPNLFVGTKVMSSHNSYIKTFAELGVFGGLSFIALYAALVFATFKVYKTSKQYKSFAIAFLGFYGAYLLQNGLNNLIFIPQLNVFVWIFTAMLLKISFLEKGIAGDLR